MLKIKQRSKTYRCLAEIIAAQLFKLCLKLLRLLVIFIFSAKVLHNVLDKNGKS